MSNEPGSASAGGFEVVEPPARTPRHFTLPRFRHHHGPVKNANQVYEQSLSPMERAAMFITDRVGSFGFFLVIFVWTILWCGYNMVASLAPSLHWKAFDPFPAFVAYLLISNVIQIWLMPLIMVGQNLQGRHSETRAELDFQVNMKAEKEVTAILHRLEQQTDLILRLMQHVQCPITPEELRAMADELENIDQAPSLPS